MPAFFVRNDAQGVDLAALDDPSLRFYADNAQSYAGRNRASAGRQLDDFLARVPAGGRILELGCGSGADTQAMLARGFDVTASDGTPEMAAEAERLLGRPVRIMRFEQLDEQEVYDGVWANACLLHVPRPDLAGVLERVRRSLKPGGVFYASFKAGTGDGLDRFGRYYNRPDAAWLKAAYVSAGWELPTIEERSGGGYDGEPTDWLHVTAVK